MIVDQVYVAGASAEVERAESVIRKLRAIGIEVICDWTPIVREHDGGSDAPEPFSWSEIADRCIEGVRMADLVIFLVPRDGNLTVGMWIELGVAIEREAEMIVCGEPPEPWRSKVGDWADARAFDDAGVIEQVKRLRRPRAVMR